MYRIDFGYTALNGYFIIEKVLVKIKRYIRLVYLHNPVVDQV
jgi:hypothetical protein